MTVQRRKYGLAKHMISDFLVESETNEQYGQSPFFGIENSPGRLRVWRHSNVAKKMSVSLTNLEEAVLDTHMPLQRNPEIRVVLVSLSPHQSGL